MNLKELYDKLAEADAQVTCVLMDMGINHRRASYSLGRLSSIVDGLLDQVDRELKESKHGFSSESTTQIGTDRKVA